MTVRVRYAPSPTGHLHIGGVRTALFNYLFAKRHGGDFILRVEDTDLDRNVPGAEKETLEGFRWLGLSWQEGPDIGGPHAPYRCTERLSLYEEALQKLLHTGAAYPCFCTEEELAAEREQAAAVGQMPRYSGKCRGLSAERQQELIAQGRKPSYRLAVPQGIQLSFDDHIRGHVEFLSDDLGDFVIYKSNGMPTYNFQVVIDDAAMQITHVIRGEEHLSNTPRQLLVYRALQLTPPVFAHLPQVLNTDRKKLSKRDPNVQPVDAYRYEGYLPAAIVNFLALLGWSPGGEEEILSLQSLEEKFSLERVNRSGAVFDVDKLRWMAAQYIKASSREELLPLVEKQLHEKRWPLPQGKDLDWLWAVVELVREGAASARQVIEAAAGFFQTSVDYPESIRMALQETTAKQVVERFAEKFAEIPCWTPEVGKEALKTLSKELSLKGKPLFMPIRMAVTGSEHGPDLQQTLTLLPREWVLQRLAAARQV